MNLTRYLKPPQIKVELPPPPAPAEEEDPSIASGDESPTRRTIEETKKHVLREIVALLERSGNVVNASKLFIDLWNREKKASTAVGNGLAIPHVRTMQARKFTLAFARSIAGIEFDAPDGAPVRFFFAVVSPPYDDKLYLKTYREVATIFRDSRRVEGLLAAADEHEVIKLLKDGCADH